ncbi:MAG: GlsB/YeaQ/YmgE family stress response membrane protein [Devosia sp.]|nr:GlsB/YeaQ/YmgE family stress response membrane protein [Devosia sp.]
MGILGAILIGFVVGILAKLITPGDPKPRGFILTTVLGIVGALLATWLGQAIGLYQSGESAGFFGALVGAVIILIAWRQLARPR